jgi:Gas vesicle protein G
MGLISGLLLLPITGPARGIQFILEQIQAEADAYMMDEGRLQAQLVNLSLRHDMGEISDEEYLAQETEILDQLDAIRASGEAETTEDTEQEDPYDDSEQR